MSLGLGIKEEEAIYKVTFGNGAVQEGRGERKKITNNKMLGVRVLCLSN